MVIGEKAQDFTLMNPENEPVSLSQFLGKKVVLYFYPKDNTPGCTRQARNFRDNYQVFFEKDVVVIGVSKDSQKAHQSFIFKNDLPFILLSDTDLEVSKAYGVWKEKTVFGKKGFGIDRTTYLIDENGVIVDILQGKRMHAASNANDIIESGFLDD